MPFISHPHLLCFCLFQSKCLTLMLVTLHSFCLHSESPNAEQESDEIIRREDAPRALVFYSVCSSLFFLSKSPEPGLGDKVLNSQVTYAVFLNREWLDAGELNPVQWNQRKETVSLFASSEVKSKRDRDPLLQPDPTSGVGAVGRRFEAGGQGSVRGGGVSGWEGAAVTSWPDEGGSV